MILKIGDERYRLRRPEKKDVPQLYIYKNDSDIAAYLGGFNRGMTTDAISDWMDFHNQTTDEAFWVIAVASDDTCIGHVALYKIDYRIGSAEFGIMIGEKARWGKGLGKEITKKVIDYGFKELRLHRVYLNVLENNVRAIHLYEKIGFCREGVLRDAQYRNGKYMNNVCMGILCNEWKYNE